MAQTCTYMKGHNHINSDGPFWYRCKRVEFQGAAATWELSQTSRYLLLEAYERAPHRQLATAVDDAELRDFVKAWGPLRVKLDAWSGSDPIADYRHERDRLALKAKLLASVAQPERQRDVLLDLAGFKGRDSWMSDFELPLKGLRMHFLIPGECPLGFDPHIQSWLKGASRTEIQKATEIVLSRVPLRSGQPGFMVVKEGRRSAVRASLGITTLGEALEWMVWQDIFQGRRFQFCERSRCLKLFRPDSRHAMKFCSERCARLEAARNYAERTRNEEATNGAQKTR
jgi:hypothetical protein